VSPVPADDGPDSAAGAAADSAAQLARELPVPLRLAFTVSWCSFLVASVATMVCFALVDPAPLGDVLDSYGVEGTRMAIYTVGFFFFYLISVASASLALWLTRPR
jgi:hypothetical protein